MKLNLRIAFMLTLTVNYTLHDIALSLCVHESSLHPFVWVSVMIDILDRWKNSDYVRKGMFH